MTDQAITVPSSVSSIEHPVRDHLHFIIAELSLGRACELLAIAYTTPTRIVTATQVKAGAASSEDGHALRNDTAVRLDDGGHARGGAWVYRALNRYYITTAPQYGAE